nr:uncharacterized protein LOC123770899 [Procambarus clarkii]
MSLVAEPTPEVANSFVHKIFNNISSIKSCNGSVTGLVSMEGEQLALSSPVQLDGAGVAIGVAMQDLLDGTHSAVKSAVRRAIEELGMQGRLTRPLLQEVQVVGVTIAWRVWWAACVNLALHTHTKGARQALRQQLLKINEDISFLLGVMGRGQRQEDEEEAEYQEPMLPLSSGRTPSGRSRRTARRTSVVPIPASRCLPLLMALIHARDVTSRLVRHNANNVDNFTWISVPRYLWHSQSARLELCVAYRAIEYGYEYSGCGQEDYVITPTTERSLVALFTAIAAHTPPLLIARTGGGRQSLVQAAAFLAGRFTTAFTLSALTPTTTLTSLLAGSLIGGWWLLLREVSLATPAILASLASTLLNIHRAHTYTPSSPVIQINGQEVRLHGAAGVLLSTEAPENSPRVPLGALEASPGVPYPRSLPGSLEALSRPVWISAPPARALVFAWLQAYGVPKAQDVCEAIDEVSRQVLGSLRQETTTRGLRLQLRLMREVMRVMEATHYSSSAVEAAVGAFRNVLSPRLPQECALAVSSVLDLLHPPHTPSPPTPDRGEGSAGDREPETLLRKMGLRVHPQQIKAIGAVAKALADWRCVVLVGPPRSGKTTIITTAIQVFERDHGLRLSLAQRSSRSQGPDQGSTHRSQISTTDRGTASTDDMDGTDIDILTSTRHLVNQQLYTLRPHSYSQSRLLGTASEDGLLPRLLQQLAVGSTHSFVVFEGKEASQCLLRLQDLPGTLLLDSLTALPSNSNLTFVVEACGLEEVPSWVLGRAGVVQVDPDTLSPAALLPKPDLVPPTPTSDRQSSSRASVTPRSVLSSTPATPVVPEQRQEPPAPVEVMHWLTYRLLQPVLQLLGESSCCSQHFAAVDIMEQIDNLSLSESDGMSVHHVAARVQAVIQVTRSIVDPSLLPELQETLTCALDNAVADKVLEVPLQEVLESLGGCSGPVYEQLWDADCSCWRPWHTAPPARDDDDPPSDTRQLGLPFIPSGETRRLSWVLQNMVTVRRPLVVVGPAASGKTTTALATLRALKSWVTVTVNVTSSTSTEELEEAVLSYVSRAAYDTLTPSTPTILCFDDIGNLSVNSAAWSYLEGLARHKGLYETEERVRWMRLCNIYIVCVCTREDNKIAALEGSYNFSGWCVYNMGTDDATCVTALSSAIMPIVPLQSHIHTALMNITVLLAERVSTLVKCEEEPFAPANKVIIIWKTVASVRAAFVSLSLSSPSSSSGVFIFNTWLHALNSQVLFTVISNKLQGRVWHEIQKGVIEGCNGIVNVPEVAPVPVWPPGLSASASEPDDTLPKYCTDIEAAREITKVLMARGVREPVCGHRGVAVGVALVVDAVHAVIRNRRAPFLLVLGPSSRDKDIIVSMAAAYLGLREITGNTEMEMLELLRREKGGDVDSPSSQHLTMVHVPATFLNFPDVLKAVLKVASEDEEPTWLCVVTGSEGDVRPLSRELRAPGRHGRVLCLPKHHVDLHEAFVNELVKQNAFLKEEDRGNPGEMANFMAWVHEAYSTDGTLTATKVPEALKSSSLVKQMPSVSALAKCVATLANLLQHKKQLVRSKLSDLETVLGRVEVLETHTGGLRGKHDALEAGLSQVASSIAQIKETLKKREADIVTEERGVSEIEKAATVVERAQDELSTEVTEYVQETKEPLAHITQEVAHLDIHRIRKLLSRSPISAVQILFECAVVVLGSTDMSWRAVRQAVQDDNFCHKLAAVCVSGLKHNVIAMLAEKLEQIKMTSEHMARISDIGGVLLQYLRSAIFFWHRYHEDVQPRQARVQALADQKKQLQVEMATKERLVRMHKEKIAELKSRLREEEERASSLRKENMAVEEELESILAVISQLNPHSERWRKEIEKQQVLSKQVMGECLLAAARLTYLTPLLPEMRDIFISTWQRDLISRGLLLQPQDIEQQMSFRLESHVRDLQELVGEAVDYHLNHSSLLLIQDPHYLIEEYISEGVWVRLDKGTWMQELKERLREEQGVLYLRAEHSLALPAVKCVFNLLTGCTPEGSQQKVVIILEDDCISAPCQLCSQHTLINVMLDHKGIVHQLIETLIKSHDPRYEEEVRRGLEAVSGSCKERERREAALIHALIHASNLTSRDELTGFMHQINNLNDAIATSDMHQSTVKDFTHVVAGRYLHVARYAARLYHMTHTLSALSSCYALPLSLLQESLASKLVQLSQEQVNSEGKTSQEYLKKNEDMMNVVTHTVFELMDMRLQFQHRLIVATCFTLAKMNMKQENEDYIRAFLVPLSEEEIVWDNISIPDLTKTSGHRDSTDDLDESLTGDYDADDTQDEHAEPEDSIPRWLPKQCDKRSAYVLTHLSERCSSLFPAPLEVLEESGKSNLLLWLARGTCSWPDVFPATDPIQQAAQRAILARHLRQDLLVDAMTDLVRRTLADGALKSNSNTLPKAILHHTKKQKARRSRITNVIQVNVSRGANLPRVLMDVARDAGLPYYKLTFLSMATASQQEIRRRVVMAARRRTWLILLDCETASHHLPNAQAALLTLPPTLVTPTVFCVVADVAENAVKCQNAVVGKLTAVDWLHHYIPGAVSRTVSIMMSVGLSNTRVGTQVERPVSLYTSLAAYLPIAYSHLQKHTHASRPLQDHTKAAVLTTAYIYAVLHAKGEYGGESWHRRPPASETLLVEALEVGRNYTSKAHMSWDVLANVLAKVVFGSVFPSQLDQQVVNKIFADHLNDHMYPALSENLSVYKLKTTSYSSDQPAGDAGDQPPAQGDATHILLHSLPSGDLTLNLQLPPQNAVENLCKQSVGREERLLGLYKAHHRTQQTEQTLAALGAFTETPYVHVGAQRVLDVTGQLQSILVGGVRQAAGQVPREADLETQAWLHEALIWDTMHQTAHSRLNLIKKAVMDGTIRPAQALLMLLDLVHRFLLHPDGDLPSVPHCGHHARAAARDNKMSVGLMKAVITALKRLAVEWGERYEHLCTWARSESPPVRVRLGLLASPGWWLTRLRQAVCLRAHWFLHGTLVYATTATVKPSERPPQGVYVDGAKLVGGCWTGETAVPLSHDVENCPLVLSLCVAHSVPPGSVGHAWIPVLEESTAERPLFKALLPLQKDFASCTPLHLLLH